MKNKLYKLKLQEQTVLFLKQIRKKYKVKVCAGPFKDFRLEDFNILPGESGHIGYYFQCKKQKHIYVNDLLPYRDGHDLVVLHEIGHLLLTDYRFCRQDESFANGFAFAMATQLKIKASKNMIKDMELYSNVAFQREIKNAWRK